MTEASLYIVWEKARVELAVALAPFAHCRHNLIQGDWFLQFDALDVQRRTLWYFR